MMRKPQKPPEGARMKDTPDMVAWRKEFESMKPEEHLAKMKELGLDEDDLEEFKEIQSGKDLESELLGDGAESSQKASPKKKAKK